MGKGEDKTTVWSFCNSRHFPVSRYSILNWWYFYICLQFYTSHMCWWYPLVLSLFFYIINVCHNLFKELCKYIMYDCRLMLISICWCMSCCKHDDWHQKICDICVYCMILLSSEFILNIFKIINAVVLLANVITVLCSPRFWSG